jgi:hypothetical protein
MLLQPSNGLNGGYLCVRTLAASLMTVTLPPAVVLVLSKAFIGKRYPMEELQLLLEWRRQGSEAKLLPVFYDITWEVIDSSVKEYKRTASSEADSHKAAQKRQWAQDLEELEGITGIRPDQVCHSTFTSAIDLGAACSLKPAMIRRRSGIVLITSIPCSVPHSQYSGCAALLHGIPLP